MNHCFRDAALVPSFPEPTAFGAWPDAGFDPADTDLDAVLLCHRIRHDGCVGIEELFDAE